MKKKTFRICHHLKKSIPLFSLLFFYVTTCVYSQNENNIWYFGNQAGIDFTSGSPVAITNSAMNVADCPASISNPKQGGILFYSNAEKVWNRNHTIMPNGNGLLGSNDAGSAAFAVKQPGSDTLYYLFTNDCFAWANGLRYSIIDMSLDNGLGDVTAVKNVQIFTPSTEKITAVMHSNNNDIWIITHPWNSNSFYVYLLTANGLSTTPVISNIGSTHTGGTSGYYNALGQMSISPDGSKVACAIYDLNCFELFDFNRSTGSLSNPIAITGYNKAWGTEFSADGTKLYTTRWFTANVYQFDITSNNQITINSSAVLVGQATSPSTLYKAGYLQRGPDSKIYVAKCTSPYVGTINLPNNAGTSCNFVDDAVYLGGKICQGGLPTYMQYGTTTGIPGVKADFINVYPNPFKHNVIFTFSEKINDCAIEITDVLGKRVHYVEVKNADSYTFYRNDLGCGVYFYKVYSDNKVISSGKIIAAN